MKEKLLWAFLMVMVISAFVVPILWAVATVQVCGWKGLFVECRITEVK